MAVKISGNYIGNLKVELLHEDSGAKLISSAPKDNAGDGSSFSPTDLVVTALGGCILTTIAIVAKNKNIIVNSMSFDGEKHMSTGSPRMIAYIPMNIHLPKELNPEQRTRVEAAAHSCPVHKSLNSEIKVELTFIYDL